MTGLVLIKESGVEVELPGEPYSGTIARDLTRDFVNKQGLIGDAKEDVLLCVGEAVQNAIRHGCRIQRSEKFRFSMWREANAVCIKVTDYGPGFDPVERLACCRAQKDTLCECGRGLMMMVEVADVTVEVGCGITSVECRITVN
jgi:anti-sigma regulatory factor (Ser/Thr protein kinase)